MFTYIIIALIAVVAIGYLFRKKLRPLFNFMKSRLFIFNFLAAIVVLVLSCYFLLECQKTNNNHGIELAAPSFFGLHVSELESFSQSNEVSYKIIDSIYSDEYAKGTVIRQDPLANSETLESKVKPGRTFYVTVVKNSIEYKTIPKLKSKSSKIGAAQLRSLGYTVKEVAVPSQFPGLILGATYNGKSIVSGGQKVPKGAEIMLEVGVNNSGGPTRVPNLRGGTITDAKTSLESVTLFLDFQCDNCLTAEDSLKAVIYKQIPGPVTAENSTVREGSDIVVFAKVGYVPGSDSGNDSIQGPQ